VPGSASPPTASRAKRRSPARGASQSSGPRTGQLPLQHSSGSSPPTTALRRTAREAPRRAPARSGQDDAGHRAAPASAPHPAPLSPPPWSRSRSADDAGRSHHANGSPTSRPGRGRSVRSEPSRRPLLASERGLDLVPHEPNRPNLPGPTPPGDQARVVVPQHRLRPQPETRRHFSRRQVSLTDSRTGCHASSLLVVDESPGALQTLRAPAAGVRALAPLPERRGMRPRL
jgi:hypothetical protein